MAAAMKLFMILLLFNFGIFCYGRNLNRIWNGAAAPDGKYPNVPRLMTFGVRSSDGVPRAKFDLCTGSIISSRHILTAAHCLNDIINDYKTMTSSATPLDVIIVDYDKLDPGGKLKTNFKELGIATMFHFPKDWTPMKTWVHDIGIIEFPKEVNLTVTPMLMAKNYEEGDNDTAISVGYGDTDPDPVKAAIPPTLMEVPVPVIKDCAWKNAKDGAKIICAGTKTQRTDHGDSGGPLFITRDNTLYIIATVQAATYANGTQADNDADFGMYTRVSAYCDWIEKTTESEAKCVDMPPALAATSHGGDGMSYNIIYSLLFFISALIISF